MKWENAENIQVPERLRENILFEFYKCYDLEGKPIGLLIKDKTKGCYPLLLCNDDDRATGFCKAVKDINKNFDKIFEILSNNIEKWDKDLEEELGKCYFKEN